MAIAGLFLGVGAAIASHSGGNETLARFGSFIQQMGDPVFASMPILFAAAIAVAFTDDAAVAVFDVIIGIMIFNALQGVFIDSVDTPVYAASPDDGFTQIKVTADNIADVHAQTSLTQAVGDPVFFKNNHDGFKILFSGAGRDAGSMEHLVGKVLGIQTQSTSVFGGIVVGAIVS